MSRGSIRQKAAPYAWAIACVAFTVLLRASLDPLIGAQTPFVMLFFMPVLVGAWLGGIGPAMVASVLGLLLGDRVSIDFSNGVPHVARVIRIGTFLVESWFIGWLFESRRREERARLESESRYRVLVENLPGGAVAMVDRDLRIVVASGLGLVDAALGGRDLVGLRPSDVFASEVAARFQELYRAALRGQRETLELAIGEKLFFVRAVPVTDASEIVIGALAVAQDITERKRLESELRETQKLEAVGKLAGGVAHDFNNLLGVILAGVDALTASATAESERKWLRLIDDAASRATDLTRQLLAFGRQRTLETESLDLNELVRAVAPLVESMLRPGISLALDLGRSLERVSVNRTEAERAIVNLCANARDAMPDGGVITVGTRMCPADLPSQGGAATNSVELRVTDQGVGMDETLRSTLAGTSYFTTKGKAKGTGLGLGVVRGFVGRSQGKLEIESEVGKGSTFRIRLPIAEAETIVTSMVRASEVRSKMRVLVVDDEESIRSLVAQYLEARGFVVVEATHAEMALEKLDESISVLIADVGLPGISGLELAHRVRSTHPRIRIVLVSGTPPDSLPADELRELEASFLLKPFHLRDLVRTVDALTEANANAASA